MKIVFVNINPKAYIFNPSIAALSASLKKAGYHPQIITLDFQNVVEGRIGVTINRGYPDFSKFSEEIRELQPDLVLFSVMSRNWGIVKRLAEITKNETNAYAICGGYHPTFFPDEVIRYPHIDAICIGEGDRAVVEIIDAFNSQRDHKKIDNFWFKESCNGGDLKIIRNNVRGLEKDLDALPFWDREIFAPNNIQYQKGYFAMKIQCPDFFTGEIVSVNTYSGRGCYYTCSYCSNKSLMSLYKGKGTLVRHRSVANLMKELEILNNKYAPDYFDFVEEIFPFDNEWLTEFSMEYKRRINRPFGIHYRVECFKAQTLKLLNDAGCKMIFIGIECGNEEYRKKYLNRNMTNKNILGVAAAVNDLDIQIITYNMIGLPFETYETIKETIDLNRKIEPAYPLFFTFQPFPGTQMYDICKENNLIPENRDVVSYNARESILRLGIPEDEYIGFWKEIEELQADCLANNRKPFL